MAIVVPRDIASEHVLWPLVPLKADQSRGSKVGLADCFQRSRQREAIEPRHLGDGAVPEVAYRCR